MKLINVFAACKLVQPVDILSYNGRKFALRFKFCKCSMRGIRLCVSCEKKCFIVSEEYIGLAYEKCMRKQLFGRVTELLNGFKNSVFTAKIRNAAFC